MSTGLLVTPADVFQVGGSLALDAQSYVTRQADQDLYDGLKAGEFCYVLNSRQMGKSSLRVRTMQRLEANGIACVAIDLTKIGSQHITPEQWYAGIARSLVQRFNLAAQVNLRNWWRDRDHLSPLQRLSEFIEDVLLVTVNRSIVIFIDEIDSVLSLNFSIGDFFAQIRECYNQRADKSAYRRLTFCLLGVATPVDLIRDKKRTPFNIGRAIELSGFRRHEVQALSNGLVERAARPDAVINAILDWTGGQPFLTQKLCKLVAKAYSPIPLGRETEMIAALVQSHIVNSWEAQDEPEHLRTIQDRLTSHQRRSTRLLKLYQTILLQREIPFDHSALQLELRLSGLVVEHQGYLRAHNRLYASIFNLRWIEQVRHQNQQTDYHLLVITDDLGQRKYVLDAPVYSIGRSPQCDIRLASPYASRFHANLVECSNPDGTHCYRLTDGTFDGKPSANGLIVNGVRVTSCMLKDEDTIFFGSKARVTYRCAIGLDLESAEDTIGNHALLVDRHETEVDTDDDASRDTKRDE